MLQAIRRGLSVAEPGDEAMIPALSLAAVTAAILVASEQVVHVGVQLAFKLLGV